MHFILFGGIKICMGTKSNLPNTPALQARIRHLVELLGGPAAFARLSGWSLRTIQNYLVGISTPSRARSLELCGKLGIDTEWLMEGRGDAPTPSPALHDRVQALLRQARLSAVIELAGAPGPPLASELQEAIDLLADPPKGPTTEIRVASIGKGSIQGVASNWASWTFGEGVSLRAWVATDESAEPAISRGDVVMLEAQDRASHADPEALWALKVDGRVLLRRITGVTRLTLIPLNDRFPKTLVSPSEVEILGRAVWAGGRI